MEIYIGFVASLLVSLFKLIPWLSATKWAKILLMILFTLGLTIWYYFFRDFEFTWPSFLETLGLAWAGGVVFYYGLAKQVGKLYYGQK